MATDTHRGRGSEAGGSSGILTGATRRIENLSDAQFAYLLLAPMLVLMTVIAFWPLASTFWMSLHADALFGADALGRFVGLENYVALLTGEIDAELTRPFFDLSNPFTSALTVTFIFVVVSVTLETIIGFGQALVLDQDFRGRRWVRVAIILPWAVPIVIQGMLFYLLFQPGVSFLIDPLQSLGIFSATPTINSVDSTIIVIVADVWKTSAFMALLILAGLQSVDRSLYDVARVEGASTLQRFRMVTLPIVLPTVLVAMLFRTIQSARVYGLIETVSSCSTVPSLSCLVVSTFSARQYGTAAAIAFVTAAVIAILVMIYVVTYADTESGVI